MKIGLIGHSHSVCLMDALGEWRSQLRIASAAKRPGYAASFDGWDATDTSERVARLKGCRIGPVTADVTGAVIFGGSRDYELVGATAIKGNVAVQPTQTLRNVVAAFQDCDLIVSVLFGNELMGRVWLDDLPPYDFLEESVPGPLKDGAQPIDRRDIRMILNGYVSRIIMVGGMIKQLLPRAQVIHLMAPPPLEDPSPLRHLEGLGDAMEQHGTLDPRLRLKWYRAYVRAAMESLRPSGVTVLPPPMAAHTPNGFLRPDLANGLTHGSAAYGAMMWNEVATAIGAAG